MSHQRLKRRGPLQEQVISPLTKMTKQKKEEIGAVAEAWHHAFLMLANRAREKAAPSQ